MLDNIKLLLGLADDSKDELLEALITYAVEDAILISRNKNIREENEGIIVRMVIYNYNRLGSEGLTSETYSGVSYNYANNYPEDILYMLRSRGKLRVLHY